MATDSSASRPRVLCLHGRQQDAELFSQRLKVLARKLFGVADLHFVSAPHELPLAPGQTVAMRCWWRAPTFLYPQGPDQILVADESDQGEEDTDPDLDSCPSPNHPGPSPNGLSSSSVPSPGAAGSAAGSAAAGAAAVSAPASPGPLAGDWQDQVVADWQASLQVLKAKWSSSGPFAGILGFSNGAAAAMLLAGHALADPATFPGLQFVIVAGGYLPQPLDRLLPPWMTHGSPEATPGAPGAPAALGAPMNLPSLHFYSEADGLVTCEQSLQLAACFAPEQRTVVEHSLGHCLPQKAPHTAAVADFVRGALGGEASEGPGSCGGHRHKRGGGGGGAHHKAAAAEGGAADGDQGRSRAENRDGSDAVAAALSGMGSLRLPAGTADASGSGSPSGSGRGRHAAQAHGPHGQERGQGRGRGRGGGDDRQQQQQQPHPPREQQQQQLQQRERQQTTGQGAGGAPARAARAPLVVGRAANAAQVAPSRPAPSAAGTSSKARETPPNAPPPQERQQHPSVGSKGRDSTAAPKEAGSKPGQAATKGHGGPAVNGATASATAAASPAKPGLTASAAARPASPSAQPPRQQSAPSPSVAAGAAAKGPPGAAPAAAAASAAAVSAAPPAAAASVPAVEAVEASEEQREEMDALEAIFMDEYRPISTAPPRFTIHLREPGAEETSAAGEGAEAGPPSRLFSLTFTLPATYPASQPPLVTVTGPLGSNDPRRHALAAHIAATAQEAVESSGAGCVFQVVEAAKEWIDTNLPADVGERREAHPPAPLPAASSTAPGGITVLTPGSGSTAAATAAASMTAAASAGPAAGAAVSTRAPPQQVTAAAAAALAAAAAGPGVMNVGWGATALGNATASGTAGNDTWWAREEADPELIRLAVAEAAASAPWRTGRTEAVALAEADEAVAESLQWGESDGPSASTSTSAAAAAVGQPVSEVGSEWSQRGRWDYVVGLVGKPSAGKSTFFNAVTDPANDEDGARVAAFPFTTIAPNVGRGYVLVPDPAPLLGLNAGQCRPLHGYAEAFSLEAASDPRVTNIDPLRRWVGTAGWAAPGRPLLWRKVPVVVKDVAGLVPGAYQGRGRGNAFLNDLCDADVLIHVVDASGTTDREGQLLETEGEGDAGAAGGPAGAAASTATAAEGRTKDGKEKAPGTSTRGGDPLDDIGWVREELHRWVYDNVRNKWSYVLRKPSRLPELFSGYHASRALVAEVLARVGVSVGALVVEGASLAHWTEAHLHRLVAHFLQARFPILLALNKADMASSPEHIVRVRHALPYDPAVPVSAATERWLCTQRRAGRVQYSDGGCHVRGVSDSIELAQQLDKVRAAVLARYGSTGAALALTCAVAMRPPRAVFPVHDLESYSALAARGIASGAGNLLGSGLDAKARAAEGANPGVLRDCVLLKPGSHIVDLFEVLKRPPYQLLEGDFIRAECSALTAAAAAASSAEAVAAAAAAMNESATYAPHGDSHHAPHASPQQQQAWRVLKKDEVLDWGNCVARVMTNRKSHWQQNKR